MPLLRFSDRRGRCQNIEEVVRFLRFLGRRGRCQSIEEFVRCLRFSDWCGRCLKYARSLCDFWVRGSTWSCPNSGVHSDRKFNSKQ